jgi:hypothetical protein
LRKKLLQSSWRNIAKAAITSAVAEGLIGSLSSDAAAVIAVVTAGDMDAAASATADMAVETTDIMKIVRASNTQNEKPLQRGFYY